jgi:hypothetical protein
MFPANIAIFCYLDGPWKVGGALWASAAVVRFPWHGERRQSPPREHCRLSSAEEWSVL